MKSSVINGHREVWFLNPAFIFWYCLVMCISPSVYFVLAQPVNFFGKLVLLLFPLGVYMLFLSLFRKNGYYLFLLIPVFALNGFQIVLFYLFNGPYVIASDMFLNVVTTSTSEADEVLDSMTLALWVVGLLYIPPLILVMWQWFLKHRSVLRFRDKLLVPATGIVFLSLIFIFFGRNKDGKSFSLIENVYPVNVLYNLGFAIRKSQKIKNNPEASRDFSYHAILKNTTKEREIIVLVIGETGRAVNWQLYGYNRPDNPLLSQMKNLVVFKDALTEANATHKSVPIILSGVDPSNFNDIYIRKGIFEAFKEAGFITVCFSNQPDNHSLIEIFEKEADIFKAVRVVDPKTKRFTNPMDGELASMMKNVIDTTSKNLFIVLHTYGSHFNYKDRYPVSFRKFTPDNVKQIEKSEKKEIVNAYDNTIYYTDYFVASTIGVLKKTHAASFLLYTSDHGEDLLDDKRGEFLHSSPIPTYYQLRIPFMAWFSEEYQQEFSKKTEALFTNKLKPVSTNSAFHTLLDAADISSPYLNLNKSLVSTKFIVRPRLYLNDHDQGIPYLDLDLAPEDRILFRENNIAP